MFGDRDGNMYIIPEEESPSFADLPMEVSFMYFR